MSSEERIARGDRLCRRLTEDVGRIAPPGIGQWDGAWRIVGEVSASFLAELTAWEATGEPHLIPRLRELYDGVVEAWRTAAEDYSKLAA